MERIEAFDRIKRVETPPYLYTRIEARIKALRAVRFTGRQLFALTCSLVLIVLVNTVVLSSAGQQGDEATTELSESFGLQTNDQLYR